MKRETAKREKKKKKRMKTGGKSKGKKRVKIIVRKLKSDGKEIERKII